MTDAQRRALEELWPKYGLDYTASPYDLNQIFNRQAHSILDIGFGMGDALLIMAEQNPTEEYIAIDVHQPGVGNLL